MRLDASCRSLVLAATTWFPLLAAEITKRDHVVSADKSADQVFGGLNQAD